MHTLSLYDLIFSFIPAVIVIGVMFYQSLQYKTALYAMARMVLQLLLIGYFIFIGLSGGFGGLAKDGGGCGDGVGVGRGEECLEDGSLTWA